MKIKEEEKSGLMKSQTIMYITRHSEWQDMRRGDPKRMQDTSCLAHLFSPFAQQLLLTVLSCGLYQLSTKGCHNMKLVMKVFLESDEDII